MDLKYHVIGHPVSHSLSPLIHNRLYKIYDIQHCVYSTRDVRSYNLAEFIGEARRGGVSGFNVTMPLKTDILNYIDSWDESVTEGANTVVIRNDRLHGYSTDVAGLEKSLAMEGCGFENKNIVVLGAGAVSRSLVPYLVFKNANKITALNRTPENLSEFTGHPSITTDSLNALPVHMPDCDILINTTSLGMQDMPHDFDTFDFLDSLPADAVVCDIIYTPRKTNLLLQAGQRGLKTVNGLGMLIWQAFYAFEHFFDILPNEEDYRTIRSLIDKTL